MATDVAKLRDEAAALLERGKLDKAIEKYAELEKVDPMSAQWPKKIAETYRRLNDDKSAIAAFERAMNKFAQAGFLVQAIAICKLILQLDATHSAAIARLGAMTSARPKTQSRVPKIAEAPASVATTPAAAPPPVAAGIASAPTTPVMPATIGSAPTIAAAPPVAKPPRPSPPARPSDPMRATPSGGVPAMRATPPGGVPAIRTTPAAAAPPVRASTQDDSSAARANDPRRPQPRAATQPGDDKPAMRPLPRPPSQADGPPPSAPTRIGMAPARAGTQPGDGPPASAATRVGHASPARGVAIDRTPVPQQRLASAAISSPVIVRATPGERVPGTANEAPTRGPLAPQRVVTTPLPRQPSEPGIESSATRVDPPRAKFPPVVTTPGIQPAPTIVDPPRAAKKSDLDEARPTTKQPALPKAPPGELDPLSVFDLAAAQAFDASLEDSLAEPGPTLPRAAAVAAFVTAPTTPAPDLDRPARRSKPPTLAPGAAIDTLDLATVVKRSHRLTNVDGSLSGITVIPLADIASDDHGELEWPDEYEVVDAAETQPIELEPIGRPTPLPSVTREARLALVRTPLFSTLPRGMLEPLIARMSFVQLDAGALVFREGDVGTSLYVISEGEVVVETHGKDIARLGAGSFFGEISLITELPRSASVRAVSRVEMLVIDRDVVREAMVDNEAIVDVLLKFVRDRLVDVVTRTSELFAGFTDAERLALSARFELIEADAGTVLVVEGEPADGLYVLLAGRVDVTRGGAPRAALVSGDVFGEMSLIGGGGAIATVKAASKVLALRMPVGTFQEVMMTHPQVLAHLSELADRRSREEAAVVDLHLDLL